MRGERKGMVRSPPWLSSRAWIFSRGCVREVEAKVKSLSWRSHCRKRRTGLPLSRVCKTASSNTVHGARNPLREREPREISLNGLYPFLLLWYRSSFSIYRPPSSSSLKYEIPIVSCERFQILCERLASTVISDRVSSC